MTTEHLKATLLVAWVLAVGALGYVSGTASLSGWTVVTVLALIPPAVIVRFWSAPSDSLSETIRQVLR